MIPVLDDVSDKERAGPALSLSESRAVCFNLPRNSLVTLA
jgi:hypothetical protein